MEKLNKDNFKIQVMGEQCKIIFLNVRVWDNLLRKEFLIMLKP